MADVSLLRFVALISALLLALYAVLSIVLGTGNFMVTITSGSMEPALYRGDIAIIRSEGDYNAGDVAAFRRGGEIYVHRIFSKNGESFKTKGDNSPIPDLWSVDKKDVLGRVVLTLPRMGYVNLMLARK
jgi:signal peptidase